MGKVRGRTPGATPIVRKPFVGDPASICPHYQPEVSRRKSKPDYQENLKKRKQQKHR